LELHELASRVTSLEERVGEHLARGVVVWAGGDRVEEREELAGVVTALHGRGL